MVQSVDYSEMLRLLPQAPPMLMVDRVISYELNGAIIARKCVSSLDPYFAGHFKDDNKVVPGLLLVEGIAQCAFLLAALTRRDNGQEPGENLIIAVKSSFRAKVVPGDVVTYSVTIDTIDSGAASFTGIASVDGVIAVRAECSAIRR